MLFVNEMAGVKDTPAFLRHLPATADGMTITDVVFPAFLFITGMAIPLALGARLCARRFARRGVAPRPRADGDPPRPRRAHDQRGARARERDPSARRVEPPDDGRRWCSCSRCPRRGSPAGRARWRLAGALLLLALILVYRADGVSGWIQIRAVLVGHPRPHRVGLPGGGGGVPARGRSSGGPGGRGRAPLPRRARRRSEHDRRAARDPARGVRGTDAGRARRARPLRRGSRPCSPAAARRGTAGRALRPSRARLRAGLARPRASCCTRCTVCIRRSRSARFARRRPGACSPRPGPRAPGRRSTPPPTWPDVDAGRGRSRWRARMPSSSICSLRSCCPCSSWPPGRSDAIRTKRSAGSLAAGVARSVVFAWVVVRLSGWMRARGLRLQL